MQYVFLCRNVHPNNSEFLLRTYKVYNRIYVQFLQLSSARFLISCNVLSSNIFHFDYVLTYRIINNQADENH